MVTAIGVESNKVTLNVPTHAGELDMETRSPNRVDADKAEIKFQQQPQVWRGDSRNSRASPNIP